MTEAAQSSNGSAPTAKRVIGRPFEPGKSGNPGGRPKGLASSIRETVPADDLKRYYEAIWRLDKPTLKALGIAIKDCTLVERNRAGEWLSDRGYGKAPAYAPIADENPLELDDVDRRIDETLDELAEAREAKAARTDPGTDLAGTGTG